MLNKLKVEETCLSHHINTKLLFMLNRKFIVALIVILTIK